MNNILFISFIILCFSCSNINDKSFEHLNNAFIDWHDFNNVNNVTSNQSIHLLNKKSDFKYIEEYILDLKRFKLELNQLNINNINDVNRYKYNSLEYLIEKLLFINEAEQPYLWNTEYYTAPLYYNLFILLSVKEVPLKDKVEFYNLYLDNIPIYINQIKKNLKYSNKILINNSIRDLNNTIFLLENSIYFINDLENLDEDSIIKKIKKNKVLLIKVIDWLENDLDTSFSLQNSFFNNSSYKIDVFNNETISMDFLKINISNIQNRLFDVALPIYLLENDEPIWVDRQDSSNVINYMLEKNISFKDKDFESQQIKFNENYNRINNFFKNKNVLTLQKFSNIKFIDNSLFAVEFGPHKVFKEFNKPITVIIGNDYSDFNDSRCNKFIVESIAPRSTFNRMFSDKTIPLYHNINEYIWGKILSRILIELGIDEIDANYEFVFYLDLLRDFNNIYIKHKYLNNELTFDKSVKFLKDNSFYTNA